MRCLFFTMYRLDSKIKVHDIEVFKNAFLYKDIDKETKHINTFWIHRSRNDLKEFIKYIPKLRGLVGYNNLTYDAQVIQFIFESYESGKWYNSNADEITNDIYKFSQQEINKKGLGFTWSAYKEKDFIVRHLDLRKVHHFENPAKMQSLKGLQCNLNYPNVQESSISFEDFLKEEDMKEVEDYCENDILSTDVLYEETKGKIELRRQLIKQYKLPVFAFNWSDSKIGEQLMLKFYCDITGKKPWDVRKERTNREEVNLAECIPSNVKFVSPDFQYIYEQFSKTVLTPESKPKFSVNYKGLVYDFGIGGIHASDTGVFESDEKFVIIDVDVGSMYPNIAISNGYYPKHLGPEFLKAYKEKIVDVRMAEKEKKRKKEPYSYAIVEGFKLAANSVYGKSNCRFSFLYDPFYTFSTTITGQLQLAMLAETICENISSAKIIQANTDGITVRLKRTDTEQFREICKKWEKIVGLELEEVIYRKMYIRDVNNYCAISENGYIKLKGCFEKDKDLHKDPSGRIVPLALEEYIVNGTPIEKTIQNHTNIYDFLCRIKFKKRMRGEFHFIENGKHKIEKSEKVTRYYIANRGKTFLKLYTNEEGVVTKKEKVEAGWQTLEANYIKDENAKNYDINYRFYIQEAQKIIDAVEKPQSQLGLFN